MLVEWIDNSPAASASFSAACSRTASNIAA
jgi:hypothetical protein